ncbi:MAG: phosphoglycerate kinase [Verrucomicrobia bacterium]|jgi:3-phosphoglycerate kinase|nr:MAG: phosphoglycerate kinase [Verrucomicrobiota bacterium]
MPKRTISGLDVQGKRVLVRVDFNVPQDKAGAITDDTRIRAALPTLNALLTGGAKVILMSHLGRPDGQPKPEYSLAPVAQRLAELVSAPVKFAADCVGSVAESAVAALAPGEILLLENVRYHAGEEKNDPEFARKLASLGEIYVNDAFGTAHRAHASTAGVTAYLPVSVAGFLIERELEYLAGKLENPARPFVVIMGGKKVSDKIEIITSLLPKANTFLIGGAMAYTFLKAQGHQVGKSLVEADKLDLALDILKKAAEHNVRFLLPVDSRHTAEFKEGAETQVCAPFSEGGFIPADREGIDIGDRAIEVFKAEIASAGTILWNGPMGVFEIEAFAKGTRAVAEAVAASSAVSIIGGGDSVTAINKFGLGDRVTFMSTGGGASLELLEGKVLPGIAALQDQA